MKTKNRKERKQTAFLSLAPCDSVYWNVANHADDNYESMYEALISNSRNLHLMTMNIHITIQFYKKGP